MRLDGKIALITGGGTGIGLDIAKRYVEEGAYVYITGRREKKLQEAVDLVGKNIAYIVADVTKKEDNQKVADRIKADKGHLDIAIANAGVYKRIRNILLSTIMSTNYERRVNIYLKYICDNFIRFT